MSIRFSGPVNATQAGSVAEYRITIAGKHGSFDARNARSIGLKSAVYNSTTFSVTLTPVRMLEPSRRMDVEVEGQAPSGLHDSYGRLIGSDPNNTLNGHVDAIVSGRRERIVAREAVARLESAPAVIRLLHRSQGHVAIARPADSAPPGRTGSGA